MLSYKTHTHIVLFRSPRDVHQIGTLKVQLGLGSTLVDWYCDATSVPFGYLLIDLSPRTNDRIRYCANSGNNPSKFYVPGKWKHLKHLDDEHAKSLSSPSVPTLLPNVKNSTAKCLSKGFYPISQRMHRQLAATKLAEKKKSPAKIQHKRKSRTIFHWREHFVSKEEVYFRRRGDCCS